MKRRTSPYFDIRKDPDGSEYMAVTLKGIVLLRLVLNNKGTAFTKSEREELGLDGLLPPAVKCIDHQVERAYANFLDIPASRPLGRYMYLRALQERQEILFYALLEQHLEEMMPIVYTPIVGEAVQRFNAMYQNPRGITLSPLNIGQAEAILENYPLKDVRMIVVTDSSAILGLGDQGYGGLAIPIGKLALYTVGGGVCPFHTAPVSLDVGTDREDLVDDPLYLGVRHKRLRGDDYFEFVDAFVDAVHKKWPHAVIQWEDLSKDTAYAVLERYRDKLPSFNDDIQGTGAVALAGVLSACRKKGERLTDQRIAIHGAGAGGIGVAWAIRKGLEHEGLTAQEASERVFVLDSRGLLMSNREMEAYKRPFAHPPERAVGFCEEGRGPDLLETIRGTKATVLLGLSGRPGAFNAEVVEAMCENTSHPIIFPLSNPTSSSEATPDDVLAWSGGMAMVATGSPFDPVVLDGKPHVIGQGNNAFIFPGLGFGALLAEVHHITHEMVLEAAFALADYVAERYLPDGLIYPPITDLKGASIRVAVRVMEQAVKDGVGTIPSFDEPDLESYVRRQFWRPEYLPVRFEP